VTRMLELVEVSERVGMSPHEWCAVVAGPAGSPRPATDVRRGSDQVVAPVPLSPKEWRAAVLSTLRIR
jgi:hypothetical protein